jgi:hypothetical protein
VSAVSTFFIFHECVCVRERLSLSIEILRVRWTHCRVSGVNRIWLCL